MRQDTERGHDPTLVVIDNYDSFVYNLVQYLTELGHSPHVIRNDAIGAEQLAAMDPMGIVISPGPCGPGEAGVSTEIVSKLGDRVPVLGVCLGHQCIGEAYGGRVVRSIESFMGRRRSSITIAAACIGAYPLHSKRLGTIP